MPSTAIVLADSDNVGVVTSDVRPGRDVLAMDLHLEVKDPIPFGHKIALMPIAAGEAIVKFGVSVGRATAAIAPASMCMCTMSRAPTSTMPSTTMTIDRP